MDAGSGNTKTNGATAAKPRCRLIGTDGNVFAVIGNVRRALERAGQRERASEFVAKAMQSKSYDEVLALCFESVDPY
jgi:hypothetical protein